jgi:hypothetical protein
MAIKVGGTVVVNNDRQLSNIASVDASTVAVLEEVIGGGGTLGTLTKSFAQDETATITLSDPASPAPVVSVTKEVPQPGLSSKGAWDVDATGSNYDIYDYATNVSLSKNVVSDFSGFSQSNTVGTALSLNPNFAQTMNIKFYKNGAEFYAVDLNGEPFNHYTLTTPYDQGSATLNSSSDFNAKIGSGIYCFLFNVSYTASSGADKIYGAGPSSGIIYELDMSTEFDPSSATYSSVSYNLSGDGVATVMDIAWNDDGTKFYAVSSSFRIYQYSITTAYDLSSGMSFDGSQDISGQNEGGIGWAEDGNSLIGCSYGNDRIFKVSLSTAYDITSTVTLVSDFDISSLQTLPRSIYVVPDLSRIYLAGQINTVHQLSSSVSVNKLVKSTGIWSNDELNKNIKVTGGGSLWVTATDGTFDEEEAPSSYPVAAGDWEMVNVEVDATNGLSVAGYLEGYVVSDLVYNNVRYNFASQDTQARGFNFSHNGSRIYMAGATDDEVYRYDLTTPYDLSTISYVEVSNLNIDIAPEVALWNPDGSKFFTVGQIYDDIRVFTASTPFDVTTLTYDGSGSDLYVNAAGADPKDFQFGSDGTKIFVVANNNSNVSVWNLSTAYVPSSGTFSTSVSFSSHCSDIYSLDFNADGSKLVLLTRSNSNSNSAILVFDLTTPWDVSTATLVGDSNGLTTSGHSNISGSLSSPYKVRFNPDGTKAFIFQYNAYVYELATRSLFATTNQYAIATTNSGGQIDTQSWVDINGMTADETLNGGNAYYAVSMDNHAIWNVAKGADGVRPIVRNNSGTWQYNTAEGISSYAYENSTKLSTVNFVTLAGASWTTSLGDFDCIEFKPDGTKVYVIDGGGGPSPRISEFDLSTPWDMSSGTFVHTKTLTGNPTTSLIWKPDGTRFYYGETFSFDGVVEYVCSTPWSVSSASHSHTETSINSDPSIQFIDSGLSLTTFDEGKNVNKYSLSSAYQLSTINTTPTQTHNLGFSDSLTNIVNHFWADSGNTLHVFYEHSSYGTKHRQYSLSVAYDLSSTISLVATNENNALDDDVNDPISFDGMTIKPDGTRMYAINNFSQVSEFSTASTAYTTSSTWVNATTNAEIPALSEALGASEFNRMDSTQLAAIPDANHFAISDTLDLAVGLYTTATTSIPTSDGVTINYDAEALNQGAILGTDYDYHFPTSTTVKFTSNAAQNLKIRVV